MKIIRSINIDKEMWELLDKISKQENRTKSNMIEKLIKDYTRQK
jgi:metal-responsive CopG/Arc/MetJ family transcriptional regulator